ERNGVDLVLTGHSHSYERSYLLHDHFGLENTFSFAANATSNSNAKYNGTANSCPYISTAAKIKHGTVYVVAGSAGQIGGTQSSFPHAAMYYSNATTGGSLAIEIQGNRLDAKFVAADNTIKDQFTIFKDVNKSTTISLTPGQAATLSASWMGNYNWNTGEATQSITINQPAGNYDYIVNDNVNAASKCLADTFHVNVGSALVNARSAGVQPTNRDAVTAFSFRVYPNPTDGRAMHLAISSNIKQNLRYVVEDISGRIIHNKSIVVSPGATQVDLNLPAGIYVVKLSNAKGIRKTEKIVVQ
ncbi:MAG: T9SS type A sorting domain-containing protein, partial [Bacteroidota bacterium]